MKRLMLAMVVLAFAALAAACNAFSSAPTPTKAPAVTLPAPVGACNARLSGKLTNTATNKMTPNAAIEISTAGKTIKTLTDPNGLYGFAGLCAGEYAVKFTPPGAQAIAHPDKVNLDGTKPVKLDLSYK